MIRYLTHNQIDMQRWDECVAQSRDGNVYSWSWYLDVVHPCWEALIQDDYETVMPLTGSKKFGIHYLFQPFFTQKFGIFSKKTLSEADFEMFLNAIPQKFKFAEFNLSGINGSNTRRNIELKLNDDYAVLAKNYNTNTKRNIAKAKKQGLSVVENVGASIIVDLFRKNRGKDIKHWGNKEYERLLKLVETAKARNNCIVIGTQNVDNQIIAGAFFMISHNRIVFLFSGADESNKENHGLAFLLDHVIRKFSGSDRIFDFEGSDNDGLARFYKGFGGMETTYQSIRFNRTTGLTRLALKIIKKDKRG